MANQADPIEALIADGRLYSRPTSQFGAVIPYETDLEYAHSFMLQKLTLIYQDDPKIRIRYGGYTVNSGIEILAGITSMADYIIAQMYNRMRGVLEWAAPHLRTTRMNTRCPVSNSMEFPAWISSTISAIGPIHFSDGPTNRYAVPATAAARMQTYGRQNPIFFSYSDYFTFISVLKEIGIATSPVDHQSKTGSSFPTIDVTAGDHSFTFYATIHHSHYENEDFLRMAFFTNPLAVTPWPRMGITVGYVNDNATLTALAAAAPPDGLPAGQTANSPGLPRGLQWNVNYYGIQPETPAQGDTPAQTRGIYVIGRGIERRFQYMLARDITTSEIMQAFIHRLYKTTI